MSKAKIGSLSALAIAAVIVGAGFSASDAKTSPAKQAGDVDPIVDMQTTQGDIKIKVFKKEAPITADNFLDLVKRGFYNGLTFHRWEPGFVIQGGDPQGNGTGGFIDPKTHRERTIKLEINPELKHDKGAVAMARSNEPNSASSQFYITLAPAHNLDGGYAVFGKVVDGMDNVLKLRNAQNSPKHVDDKIIKATIEQ